MARIKLEVKPSGKNGECITVVKGSKDIKYKVFKKWGNT